MDPLCNNVWNRFAVKLFKKMSNLIEQITTTSSP